MTERPKTKPRMVSLRMTEEQYRYLEDMAKRIRKRTGFRITRASIIIKMMEYGAPFLDREFPPESPEEESEELFGS